MRRSFRLGLVAFGFAFLLAPPLSTQEADWPVHGGDPGGMKYSKLRDLTPENLDRVEVVWSWETGEKPIPPSRVAFAGQEVRPGSFQGTPVVLDGVLYIATPYSRVVALEADTGEELWSYDPGAYEWGPLPRGCGFCHRGVAVWGEGTDRRVFINTRWRLIALDATTGEPVSSFGDNGEVDVTKGLVWEVNRLHYTHTSPPVVYENLVILGSGMPDNRVYRRNPPGDVQAFDARTGERVWSFHTIPQEGELGNETWEDGSWSYTGSTNVWAPFSLDVERGLVYLPVGTPNNDFYGGHRKGDNLFAESIVCLDARTGRRVWHFQTVHHGLWDYDLPAPPNLVTIHVEGKTIDAVAVLGKTGFIYVFDRVTGEPVWPIEERPVPPSDVPGERAAPTQPFPTRPPPLGKQGFSEDDLIDFTPELREMAREAIAGYRLGPLFTPPSLEGTLLMPGVWGLANWGGGAFDPKTGLLYVRGTNWPFLFKVAAVETEDTEADYALAGFTPLTVADGLPVHKPPYATLTAVDLHRGEIVWQVPLGDMPSVRQHPLLAGLELPPLGMGPPQHGQSGPLVTASGLLFISGSSPSLWAFAAATGALLREIDLGGNHGFGNPVTFRTRSGRQLLTIATSKPDGSEARLVTFGLPPSTRGSR